jgi:hypothetical protein
MSTHANNPAQDLLHALHAQGVTIAKKTSWASEEAAQSRLRKNADPNVDYMGVKAGRLRHVGNEAKKIGGAS